MATSVFDYPTVLTNKDWQKNKGVTGRAKKTGVGEALDAVHKALAKSPFAQADPDAIVGKTIDPLAFETKANAARKLLADSAKKTEPLIKAADDKVAKAILIFAERSDQKVRKHLEVVRGALTALSKQLGTGVWTRLEAGMLAAYKRRLSTNPAYLLVQEIAEKGDKILKDVEARVNQVEANSAISTVHKQFDGGPARSVSNWYNTWDTEVAKDMPGLAQRVFGKNATAEFSTLPWLEAAGFETRGDVTKRLTDDIDSGADEIRVVRRFCIEYSDSLEKVSTLLDAYKAAWKVLGKY